MTPERHAKISAVLAARQPDLTLVADEVHKGRNMAAMVRTCDAVGVAKMYAVVPSKGYNPYRGTALGANKWVDVEHCENLLAPLSALKQQGFQVISTALDESACDYRDVDYTKPTALVMGNEKTGISDTARSLTDQCVTIPMVGMVESLNVSVAAAVILNEAQYQRRKAGFYDRVRLPQSDYDRLFFQWAHPQVTAFCDERNLAYPPLREDGEIENPPAWYACVREGSAKLAGAPE
ncbi:tRNA (guanosine(18)-2'-O)-methyltransferase TrmH [Marinagarivorans cellulosilyticus]|uniref:tRNA (guanosine(18)-2'-O)-methyltransferase n=1 Tax=Marinagarivorans cellulosilyticus TaxID=2721545 RepID=A0AAN1WK30_9GAMM|nr:tRNA (guanosine(18)-2'-O)-methyltransferase TrmH [Marinagarivorans cellulosilyticus]BCD99037.1 tRNA (guanosine-2'-O-)-methyltransferase [Marinagarivorans cellulosilyticus]